MKKIVLLFVFVALYNIILAQTTYSYNRNNELDTVKTATQKTTYVFDKTHNIIGIKREPADVVLAVNFLDFTATLKGIDALLQWKTTNQINTSFFNVERSTDAVHFSYIDKVTALHNNYSVKNYDYTDNLASLNKNIYVVYYRLQEISKDGTGSYSKIVSVTLPKNTWTFTLVPNPAHSVLQIQLNNTSQTAIISIVDITGKTIITQQAQPALSQTISFNVGTLPVGMYIVHVLQNGESKEQKFIKQ